MIKNIYFQLEILFRFFKKNIYFVIVGIVLGSLSVRFYPHIHNFLQKQRVENHKIGLVGLYTLDNLPNQILNQVSTGLTVFTDNNRTEVSALVKEWKIENDNKDFIFTLNTDLKWHDGQKLKPADINYQISGAQIEPIGKDQIKISLTNAYSPILAVLSKPIIKKGILGLGQYQITNLTYQKDFIQNITLVDTQNNNNKKTYHFYDQEEKLIYAYKLGEIDSISDIASPDDLSNWPNTKISPISNINNNYIAIFLNTKKLDQKDLRQALAYATPKTPNKEERCISPVSPISWAYNDTVKPYNFSPQRAKELFKDLDIAEINLAVNNRKLLTLADQIKESWQNILGMKVNISIQNQIKTDNFEAVLAFAAIPQDPDQYEFWHSTQTNNITQINDPKIDKLLEEGRQTFDIQKRKEIYLEFQKILLEESPAIFLSYPVTYNVDRIK